MELTDPQKLRTARALLNWTQRDLAERAGVSHRTINAWEMGHSVPIPNNAMAVWKVIDEAGIRFTMCSISWCKERLPGNAEKVRSDPRQTQGAGQIVEAGEDLSGQDL